MRAVWYYPTLTSMLHGVQATMGADLQRSPQVLTQVPVNASSFPPCLLLLSVQVCPWRPCPFECLASIRLGVLPSPFLPGFVLFRVPLSILLQRVYILASHIFLSSGNGSHISFTRWSSCSSATYGQPAATESSIFCNKSQRLGHRF